MNQESHHTEEEVAAAFLVAPVVLKEIRELGIPGCSFRLFEDGSGKLVVPGGTHVIDAVAAAVESLIYSRRYSMDPNQPGIDFCCGLVQAAKARGLLKD